MYRLVIDEELEIIWAEVSFTSFPERRNLVALCATARLEWDRSVRDFGGHGNGRIDHHMAAIVKAIIALRESLFRIMVHQNSHSIDADTLALNYEIESFV